MMREDPRLKHEAGRIHFKAFRVGPRLPRIKMEVETPRFMQFHACLTCAFKVYQDLSKWCNPAAFIFLRFVKACLKQFRRRPSCKKCCWQPRSLSKNAWKLQNVSSERQGPRRLSDPVFFGKLRVSKDADLTLPDASGCLQSTVSLRSARSKSGMPIWKQLRGL